MKRIKLLVFSFLLCLISINIVNAKSANIIIESIELDSKSEGSTIVSEPTFSGFNIESNISFQELNDYVKYKITLKNKDDEDYIITLINDNNQSEYFEYSYEYDEELKKNSTSIVYLTIKYKEEKTIGYQENSNVELSVTLKDSEGNIVVPKTLDDIYLYIIIGVISILALLITFILLKKNKKKKVLLVLLLLMPLITYGGSKVSLKITINSKIEIIQKEVRCTTDETLEKGLTYTNGQYTYVYMQERNYLANTTLVDMNNEGWSVYLTDNESTDSVTSSVCTCINNKPITSMKYMFSNSKVEKIDLSSFNTKYVTNMTGMFENCSNIEELNLSTFNMSNVESTTNMLNGMNSLKTITTPSKMGNATITLPQEMVDNKNNEYTTISNETPNETSIEITKIAILLDGQTVNIKLKNLAGNTSSTIYIQNQNIIHIERSNTGPSEENKTDEHIVSTNNSYYPVYAWFNNGTIYYYCEVDTIYLNSNSSYLFYNLTKLESLDLSTFDTSNVINMNGMFANCSSLQNLNLGSNFDTSDVIDMNTMFSGCSSLQNLNLGSNFVTLNVTSMASMFNNCSSLQSLDLGEYFDTSNVTIMGNMFTSCSSLTSLNLGEYFDTSKVTIMSNMFAGCSSLMSLDLKDKFDTSSVIYLGSMFNSCSSLRNLDLGDKFNTSNVKSMRCMFEYCTGLISLNLGNNFYTSKVTDMSYIFNNCNKLTSLDLGEFFDTSNVTTMRYMFDRCSSLTSLDLGDKFDTSKVTDMSYMFYKCFGFTSLNLGNKFDTSNVITMEGMFQNCSNLISINLGNKFNTKNVTNMVIMFENCSSLISLDLGEYFDTSNVTTMNAMFYGCSSLITIYVTEKWNTINVTSYSDIFNGCSNLVGISGTYYTDSMSSDINYARVDKAIYDSENNIWVEDTTKPGLLSIKQSINPSESIAQFDTGSNINTMLKSLPNLVSIERSSTAPSSSSDASNISVGSVPIYAWFENETMKYYSEEQTIYLNEDSSNMFNGLNKLEDIDLKSVDTSKVENMDNMFKDCNSINSLNLGTFDMSSTNSNNNMISSMTSLKSVKTPVDVGNNTIMLPNQFEESQIDSETQTQTWLEVEKMSQLIVDRELNVKIKTLAGNISATINSEDNNIISIQRSDSILPIYMTQNNIISNDYYAYPTYAWFEDGTLYYYSEAEVIFMNKRSSGIFSLMKNLQDIDLSNFDTSKVRDMSGMFYDCSSLIQIDLSAFNTSKVIDMRSMFENCSSIDVLDLTSFDTHNLVRVESMFKNCGNLRIVDLSSFDNSNIENFALLFYDCGSLQRVFVGNPWKIYGQYSSNQTNQMFYNCNSLVGQYGTIYTSDVNGNEVNYIHPDKMVYDVNNEMWINDNSNPGLFTLKSN